MRRAHKHRHRHGAEHGRQVDADATGGAHRRHGAAGQCARVTVTHYSTLNICDTTVAVSRHVLDVVLQQCKCDEGLPRVSVLWLLGPLCVVCCCCC